MTSEVDILIKDYNRLTYDQKIRFISNIQSPGFYNSERLDEKLGLISLIITLTLAFRKKNPSFTCKDALHSILKDKTNSLGYEFIENLAVVCEANMYNVKEGNSFGLKSAKEVADKITEILDKWLPF